MNTMAIVFQLIACCYSSVQNAENPETVTQALVEAGNRTLKSLHSYLSKARHSDPMDHVCSFTQESVSSIDCVVDESCLFSLTSAACAPS
jgi:hypothetical protein